MCYVNQRPRITFNEKGICSACQFADYKNNIIDWKNKNLSLKKFVINLEKMMAHLMLLFQVVVEKIVDLLDII